MEAHYIRRKAVNYLAISVASAMMLLSLFSLGWLLFTLFNYGLPGLNWSVFTRMMQPPGAHGGLLNAIVGSFLMTSAAILLGSPIGILVGIYLADLYPTGFFSTVVRFLLDILVSSPSIIIGLFIYQIYVIRTQHFSGWAGSFALAIMVIPIVARTTENIYLQVPTTLRESVAALGARYWVVIRFVLYRVIRNGVLTGILLAFARIIGEAAPLLFTSLSNQFWSIDMTKPMANLPLVIFTYAMSPYADWQQLAWAASLLIALWVLMINMLIRFLAR